MIVEQTLKERIWERAMNNLPNWHSVVIHQKNLNVIFEAFYQAVLEEMVDKHEVQKFMDKYPETFNKEGM